MAERPLINEWILEFARKTGNRLSQESAQYSKFAQLAERARSDGYRQMPAQTPTATLLNAWPDLSLLANIAMAAHHGMPELDRKGFNRDLQLFDVM